MWTGVVREVRPKPKPTKHVSNNYADEHIMLEDAVKLFSRNAMMCRLFREHPDENGRPGAKEGG